jgi:hypothetical protein
MAEVEYQDDQFTEEQLAYLQAEPMLVVEMVKETKGKPGKSGADNS